MNERIVMYFSKLTQNVSYVKGKFHTLSGLGRTGENIVSAATSIISALMKNSTMRDIGLSRMRVKVLHSHNPRLRNLASAFLWDPQSMTYRFPYRSIWKIVQSLIQCSYGLVNEETLKTTTIPYYEPHYRNYWTWIYLKYSFNSHGYWVTLVSN